MKICPKCHISVGGQMELCPICQNGLEGEKEANHYWPPEEKLKKQSVAYKIQLLAVFSAVVISMGLDFLLGLNGSLHWSIIVAIWGIIGEYTAKRLMKKNIVLPRIFSRVICGIIIMLLITAWYVGFWELAITILVPAIVIVALISNFVLALVDRKENSMFYLLGNVAGGVIPAVILLIIKGEAPVLWSVCMMLSVVSVLYMAIFKGKKLGSEIQKRTNF